MGMYRWCWQSNKWNYYVWACWIWWIESQVHSTINISRKWTTQICVEKTITRVNQKDVTKIQNIVKCGFPYDINLDSHAKVNISTNRWEYFWLKHCDQNVIPYHPTLFLIWDAHLNIQIITSSFWSYYLLKTHHESWTTWHIEYRH